MSSNSSQYDDLINASAQKWGIDPALLKAQIEHESNFDPNAKGKDGDTGLMQLLPATSKELGVTDPYDPAQNVDAGAKYLSQLMKKYGNEDQALAAYNWGQGNLDKNDGKIPDSIRSGYVDPIKKKSGDTSSSSGTDTSSGAQAPPSLASQAGSQAANLALKNTMKGSTGSLLAQAPGTTAFGSETLGAGLPALGVVAGAYTGLQQAKGAQAELQGGDMNLQEKAALALPTFGGSLVFDSLKKKFGFGGGKSDSQRQRDVTRQGLQSAGVLDKDYNATLADGSTYDLGKDGGAKLSTGGGVADVDFSDKLSAQTVGWANPLAAILSNGDKAQTSWWAGDLTNAAKSNASDLEGSRANILALATKMGLTQDGAIAKLKEIKDGGGISNEDYNSYVYGLGTLYSGKYDKNSAFDAAQTPVTQPLQRIIGNDLVAHMTTGSPTVTALGRLSGQSSTPQVKPI